MYPQRPLYEPSGYPFDSGEGCSRPPAAASVRSRRRRRVRGGGRGGPRPIGTSPRSGRRAYSRIIRAHRSGCRGTRASIQRADVRGTGCAIGGRRPAQTFRTTQRRQPGRKHDRRGFATRPPRGRVQRRPAVKAHLRRLTCRALRVAYGQPVCARCCRAPSATFGQRCSLR